MAVLLQALTVRMGIAGGRDLAQFCADRYSKPVAIFLWLMAEAAIIATDLAEVIGTAIALNLLFGMPLTIGVVLTALDVFLILWLQGKGFRKLEAVVIALTAVIAVCFIFEMVYADPVWGDVLSGYVPQVSVLTQPGMLYLALGHHRRHGHAAQSLPAFGHRADPQCRADDRRQARRHPHGHHRRHGGADLRAVHQLRPS